MPMPTVNIHDAKTHLSRYLEDVTRGEEIIIARAGRPVAKLVPVAPREPYRFGALRGRFMIPDDFDAPLPDELLAAFEGQPLQGQPLQNKP